MKLSVSNIAWTAQEDITMYSFLQNEQINALEIAPTRIFPENPYEKLREASIFRKFLSEKFALSISSIQSIWFGRKEKLFSTKEERDFLLEYTKKAILFAEQLQCGNLVFGCPKNRVLPVDKSSNDIIPFFRELGEFAQAHHTCIGIEANPPIYGTNFLNTTIETFDFVSRVDSSGVKVNLDVGAMLYNQEQPELIKNCIPYISHIHISEPNLEMVQNREFHHRLANILRNEKYSGYISLEMKNLKDEISLKSVIQYLKTRFGR